jgi:hypothetical protein
MRRLTPPRQTKPRAGAKRKRGVRRVAAKATVKAPARKPSPMTSPLARQKRPRVSRAVATVGDAPPRGLCAWCREPLTTVRGRFCSRRCRQVAFRLRHRPSSIAIGATAAPSRRRTLRLGYLDISGAGAKVPRARLARDLRGIDGWAMSASPLALRTLLLRYGGTVCAWSTSETSRAAKRSKGTGPAWEALIVKSPRKPHAGAPDALFGGFRGGAERQAAFGPWVISLLGALPGDQVVDLVGPDGVVARAWRELGGAAIERYRPRPRPARPRRRPAPPSGHNHVPVPPLEVPDDGGAAEGPAPL